MNNHMHGKVPFGQDLALNGLTFNVDSVATISESVLDGIIDAFNHFGFVILECAPRSEPRENLLALTPFFGRVVPHNRSDRHGVLAVNALHPVPGFIDSVNDAHPPHTDGSFKDSPERVVALQCVVPAQIGGTTLLCSGKLVHDALVRTCPQDLLQLYSADTISIQRNEQHSIKPIFRWEDNRVTICFRMDQTAQIHVKSAAQRGFTRLKEILDANILRFDLVPHQILIIDNLSLVHGREAFSADMDRQYHRLNFDGEGLLDLQYGFLPDEVTSQVSALSAYRTHPADSVFQRSQ